MSKYIPGNQKHLTLSNRIFIQDSLDAGMSFKDIACFLCKDPTTISKEVRLHRKTDIHHRGSFINHSNFCAHRYHCRTHNACGKVTPCQSRCVTCPKCNQVCARFQKERCDRLDHTPYVCNGCPKFISQCPIAHKYHYQAKDADAAYHASLRNCRTGVNLTPQELLSLSQIVSPLIQQGQSPYVIVAHHPELNLSVRTLYSYIDAGLFSVGNIDLQRKVKFKPRRVHSTQITNRAVFIGRTYADFKKLDPKAFTEMDTVYSAQGSHKTLLTFFTTREKLFLAFLMNRRTTGAVHAVFNRLEKQLGLMDFLSLFNVLLTDRGGEFGDPDALEIGPDGVQRSQIFYCDPMRSGQKGGIEQAHTLLRTVLPKGTCFEALTQWDVRLIVNHINSTPRKVLGGRTPYSVALETYGEEVLKKLQLRPIAPDEINLKPKLIKGNR